MRLQRTILPIVGRGMALSPDQTQVLTGRGGFLLVFNSEQKKDIHRFQLPALARDMDYHVATERAAAVRHDHHPRIAHLHAKAAS
jgi:hypothetical protein